MLLSSTWLAWAFVLPSVAVFVHRDVVEPSFAPAIEENDDQLVHTSDQSDVVRYAINHCKKIAFVHIQKTGGTSLLSLFGKGHTHLGNDDIPADSKMPPGLPVLEHLYLGSASIKLDAVELRKKIGVDEWENAYTVAFVRDPYDYFVSYYFFQLYEASKKREQPLRKKQSLLAGRIVTEHDILHGWGVEGPGERLLGNYTSLALDDPRHKIGFEIMMRFIKDNKAQSSLHTQLAHVSDASGNILVKHIMKTGSAEQQRFLSCSGILKQVCTDGKALASRIPGCIDKVVSAINVSPRKADSIQFYSPEMCAMVATHFARDFDAFGFDKQRCPH
eukprot:TRINITY_DN2361_c0_g2_i2.p1 TRINITY_DN2361_c0_g2~~TRINITY_DN2361_c0_g2_i2.p1  ORF type:complete len:332 (-),score=39.85 TRINITY_DN2361_c0_g2_i2:75-1070(-)